MKGKVKLKWEPRIATLVPFFFLIFIMNKLEKIVK